jgi:hypothetical protein
LLSRADWTAHLLDSLLPWEAIASGVTTRLMAMSDLVALLVESESEKAAQLLLFVAPRFTGQ